MKRGIIYLCSVVVTLLAVLILAFCSLSFQESLLAKIYDEETVYSDGYNSLAWSDIQIGDSLEIVKNQLGEPLGKNADDGYETFFYSGPGPNNISYRMRVIHFDHNLKVKMKIQKFYID